MESDTEVKAKQNIRPIATKNGLAPSSYGTDIVKSGTDKGDIHGVTSVQSPLKTASDNSKEDCTQAPKSTTNTVTVTDPRPTAVAAVTTTMSHSNYSVSMKPSTVTGNIASVSASSVTAASVSDDKSKTSDSKPITPPIPAADSALDQAVCTDRQRASPHVSPCNSDDENEELILGANSTAEESEDDELLEDSSSNMAAGETKFLTDGSGRLRKVCTVLQACDK